MNYSIHEAPAPSGSRRSEPMSTRLNQHAGQGDCGLLLVGHGSRDPEGVEEFLATVRLVAQGAAGRPAEPCFLEFARPTIAEGFATLARRGVRTVVVVPTLLFSAGHVQRDIPAAVAAIAADYPNLSVEQTEHLGCHEALVELSKLRYFEALAGLRSMSAQETALVMVGRGSHDAQATAEMLHFVELRRLAASAAHIYASFIAMADPPLEHVLAQVARGCATHRGATALALWRHSVGPHRGRRGTILRASSACAMADSGAPGSGRARRSSDFGAC